MKVAVLGLGRMGEPIARSLLDAGHDVIVWNRTPAKAEPLGAAGARVVGAVSDACEAGIVLTMVADDRAVESIVFGERGMLGCLEAGGVHVSLSTISLALSRRLAEAHAARGQAYVAAPVFGRSEAARARKLVVVAAGAGPAIERCRPLLEAIGRKLVVLGPDAPHANLVKLAGNFLFASAIESLGEAFALVRKSGIDAGLFQEVVGEVFQSPVYHNYGRIVADRKHGEVGFALPLGLKDVRLLLAAAEEATVPLPLAALLWNGFLGALARGHGDEDWSAIARVAAENAGLDG